MGCCVSKCKPKRQFMEEMSNHVHVQDKLVISQTPKTPPSLSNRISPLPILSSTSNSSFASYFSTSSSATATTTCSLKPGSSSPSLPSKDRSFSNEFLLACVKDNPHIIRMNPIKEVPLKPGMNKPQGPKRVRSSSPTATVLARQKSFRREAEMGNSAAVLPCRALRSPSPSRRLSKNEDRSFRGILGSVERESHESKRVVGTKLNALNSVYATLGRDSCLRNRETRVHRVSSKIDQVAVGAAVSQSQHQISESLPPEDFDNPLISLDCFIFL